MQIQRLSLSSRPLKRLIPLLVTPLCAASLMHCASFSTGTVDSDNSSPSSQSSPEPEESSVSDHSSHSESVAMQGPTPAPAASIMPAQEGTSSGVVMAYGGESKDQSLKTCGYYAIPDAFLGLGALVIIPNPLTPIVVLGFAGGHYYTCYHARQEDLQRQVDLSPTIKAASEAARRQTTEELRADFEKERGLLEREAASNNQIIQHSLVDMRKALKDTSEQQQKEIEKVGNRAVRELYEQLDVVRHAKVEIHEQEDEDYIPKAAKSSKTKVQKSSP